MRRLLSGLLLILVAAGGAVVPARAAQQDAVTVWIRTASAGGEAITAACYTIAGASIEGCDENRDGAIRFRDIPPGEYTVRQTTGVPGYLPVGAFPITIFPHLPEQYIDVVMARSPVGSPPTADIAIRAVDPLDGGAFPGGCVILHGGSLEGCDENGDARIDFADVPIGTYLLEETVTPEGAFPLGRQWIVVLSDGVITVLRPMTGAYPDAGRVSVALVTRDPRSGDLLAGACYIIEGASVEGCDENGDGQVDFADVPPGIFTVRQTRAPAGHAPVNDFRISVVALDPEQSLVVRQAPTQHDAGHRNVSVVFYDTETGQRLRGGTCLEIVGASLEGCDENADGQVDFLDVAVGSYPVAITRVPAGYRPALPAPTLFNDPENPFPVTVVYIGLTPVR